MFSLFAAPFCIVAAGCIVSPDPLTEDEHMNRFLSDKAELAELQDSPYAPLTIQEAIARTIHFNLDNRLAQMEEAFSHDQLAAAKLQMLPRLAVNAGYSMRNNESASTSISYEKRTVSLEPSVSTERLRETADIGFSWSLLDFGLGYFQAKQQANRYLILVERRRRILNNLVKEVIIAYYRVASLEKIRPQVETSLVDAQNALETYRRLEQAKTSSVTQALEQQRMVITLMAQLRQLSTELAVSRSRLAALMNLPQGAHFELASHDIVFTPPQLATSLPELEDIGVFLRPDLREESYQERVDKDEVKKEMLRMFPGISVFSTANYDANKYLTHNGWYEAGARASLDLIGLAGRYKQLQAAKTQTEVAKIRRLAGTVAAMVQIDMSYYQYLHAMSQYSDSSELKRIDNRLLEISSAEARTRTIGRLDHIMQTVSSVNSQLDTDRKMIDVLTAWANLFFSIGGDILGDLSGCDSLDSLERATEEGLQRWLAGELPYLPDRPEFNCNAIASSSAFGTTLPGTVRPYQVAPWEFTNDIPVDAPPVATTSASYQLEASESTDLSTGDELFEIVRHDIVETPPVDNTVDLEPPLEQNTPAEVGSRISVKL